MQPALFMQDTQLGAHTRVPIARGREELVAQPERLGHARPPRDALRRRPAERASRHLLCEGERRPRRLQVYDRRREQCGAHRLAVARPAHRRVVRTHHVPAQHRLVPPLRERLHVRIAVQQRPRRRRQHRVHVGPVHGDAGRQDLAQRRPFARERRLAAEQQHARGCRAARGAKACRVHGQHQSRQPQRRRRLRKGRELRELSVRRGRYHQLSPLASLNLDRRESVTQRLAYGRVLQAARPRAHAHCRQEL